MINRLLSRVDGGLWFLLVVSLPVTSLPLVSALAGGSMVAPPAGLLALVLLGAWLLPQWVRGRGLLPHSVPLLLFFASAVVACLAAYFIEFPVFRTVNFTRQQLVELATLVVGVGTFLLAASYPQDEGRLRATLRWLNWSGLALLLWSAFQFGMWQWKEVYPEWMVVAQSWFSTTKLFPGRVTGFALEPSWLAHQLNMLYLPLWLAASVRRFSAHGWRVMKLSFENLLLAGGVVVLWLSLSRVGLLAFLLMLGLVFILLNAGLVGWLQRRILARRASTQQAARLLRVGLWLGLLVFYLALLLGTGAALSRLDYRMERLFDFSTLAQDGFLAYANQLQIAERLVFWQTGWGVFNDYPWLGVGLGNSGYFFPQKMPGYGYGLTEVNQILYRESALPNTKALWPRLLAETGLVGLAFFAAWLFLQWANGDALSSSAAPIKRALGLAGQLVVLGLLVEGFSVDTFALPYFWFLLGLCAAAWRIST